MRTENYLFATTYKGFRNVYNLTYRGVSYKLFFYEERSEETVPNWFVDVIEIDGKWEASLGVEMCFGTNVEFDKISAYPSMKEMIRAIEEYATRNVLEFIQTNK